ncbi:MAG: helix-turn-helix transcriptional regulator [Rhizomicrobium sp.]
MEQAPTLSELAAICKLSERQLSCGFKISRGISIGGCVMQRRLENAKRLLSTGERVKSVAYSMGFASPSSFCYGFRQAKVGLLMCALSAENSPEPTPGLPRLIGRWNVFLLFILSSLGTLSGI